MIEIKTGNIFTTSCQTIVNTINCTGVMGAGIALEFRYRYPEMFLKYRDLCSDGMIDIGMLWIYKSQDKWVLNFPTKKNWKYPSKEEYLHEGLKKFVSTYKERGIESIAFPLLGADKGGIDSDVSLKIMTSYLSDLDIHVEVYNFDKNSKDDIYELINTFFHEHDIEYVSKVSNISKKSLMILLSAMEGAKFYQLNQFSSVKGVGAQTMEKLYSLAFSIRDGKI